jgi:hypothetical protein
MTTTSQYRHYAHECIRWAAQAKDNDERQAFLEMADAWKKVALIQTDVAHQTATDLQTSRPSKGTESRQAC